MQPARIHPFRAIYFIIFVHFCHVHFISQKYKYTIQLYKLQNTNTKYNYTNIRIATIIGDSNAYYKFSYVKLLN